MREKLTDERRGELDSVNRKINRLVKGVEDKDQYGVPEYWIEADRAGDCEDYALRKRKELRALGWPMETLDMAVCRLPGGAYHAVLIARCEAGDGSPRDLVLDNLGSGLKEWDSTGYSWVMVTRDGKLTDWAKIL